MRVLVTGGTGYLGGAVVRVLAERGHQPVVFARHASSARLPGEAVDADIRDRAALERAAHGVDAICHMAALVKVWRPDPHEFDEINIGGLDRVLHVVAAQGVPRLVYTSSFLARPPAGRTAPLQANDYQRTKAVAYAHARRAQQSGAPIVILIPGLIYGPGLLSDGNLLGRLLADHFARRLPGLVGADRIWSFAWVEDVAQAHVAALEHERPAAEYTLGGDNAPQIRAFEILRQLRGGRLPRRIPDWLAIAGGLGGDAYARLFGRPPLLTRRTVQILRCDWPLDHAAAARDLAYRVRPLADGIGRTVAELDRTAASSST